MSTTQAMSENYTDKVTNRLDRLRRVIREGRAEAGISQGDLGAAIGRTQREISYLESGSRPLRVDDAIAIAAALRPALGRNILEVLCDD